MTHSDVVMDFINAWNRMDWDAVEDAFTDDVCYHNMPMQPLEGKAAAVAFIRGMAPKEVDWEVMNIAENGNVVMTERVDKFVMADDRVVSVPVMGVMEIEHGKISAWRDYFDLATFTAQMEN